MNENPFLKQLETTEEILAHSKIDGYWVGGWIRDQFLNRQTNDFDLAVNKNPKQLAKKFADKFEASFFNLKEEKEIYRICSKEGFQIDVAKFKGNSIANDLSKRDFTINAIAMPVRAAQPLRIDPEEILDPYNGRKDLERKTVRQISPDIYSDDPLRLLRAFRIAAQLQFTIDPETFQTICGNKVKILKSAWERIREEILLLLDCSDSYPGIRKLDESGLISVLFPEIDPNRECALNYYPGKGVWGHSLDGLKQLEWIFLNLQSEFPKHHQKIAELLFEKVEGTGTHSVATLMKLSILFHDIGKASTAKMIDGRLRFYAHQDVGAAISKKIAKRLRCSTQFAKELSRLVQSHMRPGSLAHIPLLTDRAKYKFFRDLGSLSLPMLIVALADRYTYLSDEERGRSADPHEKLTKELIDWHYEKLIKQISKKPKLIDGTILMEKLGLTPGPLIGDILKEIDEAFVLGEIHTPQEAITFSESWLKQHPASNPEKSVS